MIEHIELIAFVSGVAMGLWWLPCCVQSFFTIFYHFAFRTENKFARFYDEADDRATHLLLSGSLKDIDSYPEFVRLHRAARQSSYEIFRSYYDSFVNFVFRKIFPMALMPAIVFLTNWYYYILGVVTVFICLLCYDRYVKQCTIGFYQRLMISMILGSYQKNQSENALSTTSH